MYSKRRGFTLIEIIVAATICSIVAIGLGAALVSGLRLWNRIQSPGKYQLHVVVALEQLARQLRQSVNVSARPFNGRQNGVSFVSVTGDSLIEYAYEYRPTEGALVVEKRSFSGKEDNPSAAEPEYVLRGVDALAIRYLSPEDKDGAGEWADQWDKPGRVPLAVRIEGSQAGRAFGKTVLMPASCGK
jgi:prepilin-type N-terminal cleavage/methylation domain-containing protein